MRMCSWQGACKTGTHTHTRKERGVVGSACFVMEDAVYLPWLGPVVGCLEPIAVYLAWEQQQGREPRQSPITKAGAG